MFAAADAVHIIGETADLSRLQLSELDTLRAHYAKLQRGLDLYMVRRSAWVCSTATTCRLVEYWLDGRHSRDGQQTEVVVAADVADVFPLFSQEEIEEVQEDVVEIQEAQEDAAVVQQRILEELRALRAEVTALRGTSPPPQG